MNFKNYFKIQHNDIKSLNILFLIIAVFVRSADFLSLLIIITLEIAYMVWLFFTLHKASKNPEIHNYGKGYFPTINTYFMSILFAVMALMGMFFKPLAEKPGTFYYLNLLFLYLILISTTILNYRLITSPDTFTYKGETFDWEDISEVEISVDNPKDIHLSFVFKSIRRTIDLNRFSSEETLEILSYFGKLREEIKNS